MLICVIIIYYNSYLYYVIHYAIVYISIKLVDHTMHTIKCMIINVIQKKCLLITANGKRTNLEITFLYLALRKP